MLAAPPPVPGSTFTRIGPALSVVALPYLSQIEFDHLLWSADLAFVRGEDSVVRAIWAGVPFVWQLYPQADAAHQAKLEAFLQQLLADAPATLASRVAAIFRGWNDSRADALDALRWPSPTAWRRQVLRWRERLAAQDDLVTQLQRFAAAKR